MDRLAAMAERHWRKRLPGAYSAIPVKKRAGFFELLAKQAYEQIVELEDRLAGKPPPDETFAQRLGRLTEARSAAEQQVIRELILPEPTPELVGLAQELNADPAPEQEPEMAELEAAIAAFWSAREEMDEPQTEPTAT